MPSDIPPDLLDLQRAYNAALAATKAAGAAGGDLAAPMAREREAQEALAAARDAAGLGAWADAKRIMEAVAAEDGE